MNGPSRAIAFAPTCAFGGLPGPGGGGEVSREQVVRRAVPGGLGAAGRPEFPEGRRLRGLAAQPGVSHPALSSCLDTENSLPEGTASRSG